MRGLFIIFVVGLVGSNYPMKGEVTTPAPSFFSHEIKIVTMNQEEIWKDVKGYEGYYQVSNLGRVKSLERTIRHWRSENVVRKERILRQNIGKRHKYALVILSKENIKTPAKVHRLVAEAFISNPENKPTVNHINSIRHDNRVENLEWATVQENIIHGIEYGNINPPTPWKGKFGADNPKSKPILQMDDCGNIIEEHIGIAEASRKTGAPAASISNCCRGVKLKHAGGYVWKYKL